MLKRLSRVSSRLAIVWCCLYLFGFAGDTLSQETPSLRFGISAMISPKDTISSYRQILWYLSEKLDMPVQMVQRKDYEAMDELLKNRNVQIAMLCSGSYVADHDEFGAELLVAPEMYGRSFYHSFLLVQSDSDIKNLEDLRGKVFAFTDPKSNTGCLVPCYMLKLKGETPGTFFKRHIYSGNHTKSIEMVAAGEVDGAAVDNLVWEYIHKKNPEMTAKTRILIRSPGYGMPPVVVHPDMAPDLKSRIRTIFLNMHNDETGRMILEKIAIDRFFIPQDSDYDCVREMMGRIKADASQTYRKQGRSCENQN